MTGLLIIAGLVLLLVLALGRAHHRADPPWRPGYDTRNDRDLARLREELRAADSGPGGSGPRHPTGRSDAGPPASRTTLAA